MKKVFSKSMCIHVWAQQTQYKGRTSNHSVFFEKNIIWSYGKHFPLAVIIDDTVIYNNTHYSVTTSTHQSIARQATNHFTNKLICPTPVIREIVDNNLTILGARLEN